jgi:hypothetical protein
MDHSTELWYVVPNPVAAPYKACKAARLRDYRLHGPVSVVTCHVRGLCDGLITRPGGPHCVCVCVSVTVSTKPRK